MNIYSLPSCHFYVCICISYVFLYVFLLVSQCFVVAQWRFSFGAEVSDEGFVNVLRGAHLCPVVALFKLVTNFYQMLSPVCEVTMRFHFQRALLSLRNRESGCPGNIQSKLRYPLTKKNKKNKLL